MGIVEETLADFRLTDGTDVRVEYNEGDIIHLHVDCVRIDMSVDEFLTFADVVVEGHEQLLTDKDLSTGDASARTT